MKSKTIGKILHEERLRQGYSLEEFSQLSQIKPKFLRALEHDEFSQLPAATFVKGFIKAYARILDFDHQPLLALLRRDYQQSAEGKLVAREFSQPVMKRTRLSQPITFVVLGAASLFIVLLSYVLFQWYSLNRPPKLQVYEPEEDQFVSSEIVVSGQTELETVVTVNAQPVALKPDGTFRTQIYLPKEGIATITVEVTDRRGKKNLEQRTVYVKF